MIVQILSGLPAVWLLYCLGCLVANVRRARRIGFPIKLLPVSPMNVLWAASEPLIYAFIDRLPFTLGSLGRYGRRAWHFKEKATSHMELGDAFSIVSPGEIFIYVSDPDAITDIFARRADFARPLEIYRRFTYIVVMAIAYRVVLEMLAVYGSNVSTVSITPSVVSG